MGLAAVTTSLASYLACGHPDLLHSLAAFFGVFIGGVTFTGSLAAFRKLANIMPKEALNLPSPHLWNRPIMAGNMLALGLMLQNPAFGALALS